MAIEVHVEGYDAYIKELESRKGNNLPIYLHFTGSKTEDGTSWCPDCVKADPVIQEGVKITEGEFVLIHVGVGPRDVWKDSKNQFRTDPKLKLKCVPTMLKLDTSHRLEEDQCCDKNLVNMMFED